MSIKTRNPAALAQGRAGMSIIGLDDRDATSHSANSTYPQAYLSRKFHLQPVTQTPPPEHPIPELRGRFDLTTLEACTACEVAGRLRSQSRGGADV